MVLTRALVLFMMVTGCSQSLFDNGGTGGGDDDNGIPNTCPADCLADAAADFDGTPGGVGDRWRYFDDHRDRTWQAMTPDAGGMVGSDPANHITTCAARGGAACGPLPGALLVSSAGATSTADPAIAFTATAAQVLALTLRVHVPGGGDQVVRIYRNSREDVLFTGTATAGVTLEHAITVDALPADRFMVALAPTAMGSSDVGLQFFISATGAVFPSQCQLAVPFSAASGNTVDNLCGGELTSYFFDDSNFPGTSIAQPPILVPGPFPELGSAADIALDHYYEASAVLDKTGDVTVQLWMLTDVIGDIYAVYPFSDMDLDAGGGLALDLFDDSGIKLEFITNTSPVVPRTFAFDATAYAAETAWHFVRVTHTNGTVAMCLDGALVGSFPLAAGGLQSTFKPHLGKNVEWSPTAAHYDGKIDDVRVFTGALPCD